MYFVYIKLVEVLQRQLEPLIRVLLVNVRIYKNLQYIQFFKESWRMHYIGSLKSDMQLKSFITKMLRIKQIYHTVINVSSYQIVK